MIDDAILLLTIVLGFSLCLAFVYYRLRKSAKSQSIVILDQIKSILAKIRPFVSYEKYPEIEFINTIYKEIEQLFATLPYFAEDFLRGNTDFIELQSIRKNSKKIRYSESLVNQYIEHHLSRHEVQDFFNNFCGIKLDLEQRIPVLHDEKAALVVAAAGSGKTMTIAAKVAYLIKFQHVHPDRILLITFTDKASKEMGHRVSKAIGKQIDSMTFHKLGLTILSEKLGYKPSIADENTLPQIIDQFFSEELTGNSHFTKDFIDLFSYYLSGYFDESDFDSKTLYAQEMKSADLETLRSKFYDNKDERSTIKGEKVKSLAELMIANFFFVQGIDYIYEPKYEIDTATKEYRQYQPDFYLPKYEIYIEHFGINRDGDVPWLRSTEKNKYLDGMEWKRQLHKEKGTTLLETYSYQAKEGILIEQLQKKLIEHGVELTPIDQNELINKLIEKNQNFLAEFKRLIQTFITLLKESGKNRIDESELLVKLKTKFHINKLRAELFLRLISPILNKYETYLNEKGFIDFPDMINQAIACIGSSYHKTYDYVIIDEYQDISESKSKLVDAILRNSKAKLFCVGDDWQSIFRFAGSDLYHFTSFSKRYPSSIILKIQKTYRNPQEIVDLSSSFILKNKAQEKKQITATKHQKEAIHLYSQMNIRVMSVISQIIHYIIESYETHDILILGRYNFDLDKSELNQLKEQYPDASLNFLTVHKAKGLEADHVIIINNKNHVLGFPSKIEDDEILTMVLSHEEGFDYAEERRLFYVALTRAKHTCHLIIPNQESIFINELRRKKDLVVLHDFEDNQDRHSCPRCDGYLQLKTDQNGKEFFSCSNYPYCDYASSSSIDFDMKCECGDYMVKRKGIYGWFWGCASFPECRKTVQVFDEKDKNESQK
jgi:DNA helicase IV